MTTLDQKGIEAALYEMIDKGDFYYSPHSSDVETAILAYLQATDSVVVPREPTEEMLEGWWSGYHDANGKDPDKLAYQRMIQAAEGK